MFVRLPADRRHRRVGADRRRRRAEDHHRVDAGPAQRDHLGRDRRVGDLEALGHDDLALVGAETGLEPGDVVLAVAVVLVDDADLRAGQVLDDVPPVDRRLRLVVGLPADRVLVLDVVGAPLGRAGRDVELRHLLLVEVRGHRLLRLGAEAADEREDLVLLDELLRLLDGQRRVVAVVLGLEGDLPAEDAALPVVVTCRVHVAEVRLHPDRDRRVAGCRSAERERPPDGDRAWPKRPGSRSPRRVRPGRRPPQR